MNKNNNTVEYDGQQGEVDNVSIVYANDTVDFGTTSSNVFTAVASNDDKNEKIDERDNDIINHHYLQHDPSQYYLNTTADSAMIDNRQLIYIPIRLACGVCAYCSPDVLSNCPMVLRSIQADLTRALKIFPLSVHDLIRKRTNLWLNWRGYAYGPKANPNVLRHVTTHHGPDWLTECAYDSPQKAMGIEVYSCVDYQSMRLHWNGSGLLIHELCHLIHQCCMEDGLENRTIRALFEHASLSRRYEKVLRRDWAGKTTNISNTNVNTRKETIDQPADFDLAYAMVDKKEFFAEISVAFLCNGYHALNKANPNDMKDCSPPLLNPDVTERVLAQLQYNTKTKTKTVPTTGNCYYQNNNDSKTDDEDSLSCFLPIINQLVKKMSIVLRRQQRATHNNHLRMVDPVFQEDAMSRNCIQNYHCNKFYPFTRGQLKYYDPDLFCDIRNLWKEISMGEDPYGSIRTKNRLRRSRCCPLSISSHCT